MSLSNPSYLKQGNDAEVAKLIKDMNAGNIAALFTYNANPSYTLQNAKEYNSGVAKVGLTVATSLYNDESAAKMLYALPDNHYLESWGDANPSNGVYSLMQPTIAPLFNGRQFQESMMVWMGQSDYHTYLQNYYYKYHQNYLVSCF